LGPPAGGWSGVVVGRPVAEEATRPSAEEAADHNCSYGSGEVGRVGRREGERARERGGPVGGRDGEWRIESGG